MQPFQLHIPTKVLFGADVLRQLGREAGTVGKRALLVYGGGSIKRNGVYDTVMEELSGAGIEVTEFGGVKPNPVVSHARDGVGTARNVGVDFIVAAGGGSVIDEAKAIAAGAVAGGDVWDFYIRRRNVEAALPVLAVQTLPASSSEMNGVSVLTNEETREKFSIRSTLLCPRVSFLDPAVTTSIPFQYTAYACTDILSHMMEGYFTSSDDNAGVQDGMVEGICRAVMAATDRLQENPRDLDARSTVMWAGALAWSGLMNAGVIGASIPNHMLEHPLSAWHDIAHGAGLSIIIPAWMRFVRQRHGERMIRFGKMVLGMSGDELTVDQVVAKLEGWYRKIGTPVTFAQGGITRPNVDGYTTGALQLAKLWGVPGYTEEDIREIYRLAGA
jgi:alcohol dehydrogenase YqhD (iron-dependent ADH family)